MDAGPLFDFTFDLGVQGWNGRSYNIGDPPTQWSSLGHAASGSIEGTVTFVANPDAGNEIAYIRFAPTIQNPALPKQDLTGRTVTVWAYVESTTGDITIAGFVQGTPPGSSTVTFIYGGAVSVFSNTTPAWTKLTVVVPGPSSSWDPTMVNQWGVEIAQIGATGTAGQVVIAVDDCLVQ